MIRFVLIFVCLLTFSNTFSQDLCSGATDLGTLFCGDTFADSGNSSDTPDSEAVGCMIGLNGTWYTFQTDASVQEMTFSGSDYEVFEGDCSSLTDIVDCGTITIVADASLTYFVLVNGDFTIEAPDSPSNDDCGNAINANGGISGENNNCATPDFVLCGSDGNATVWYEYNVDQDLISFEISLTSTGITSAALALHSDCGFLVQEECGEVLTSGCLEAGTYYIQVGSDFGNTGGFDLAFAETAVTASNNSCNEAIDITPSGVCAPENVSGDSTGACPETSGFGCQLDQTPTVWFEVTATSTATSFDFSNLSSNLQFVVLDGCNGAAFSGCISGDTNVPINGGDTYVIGATLTTGEGSFDFDITVNEPPENDFCGNALPIDGSEGFNTCCGAIEGIDGCGGSETGVWLIYFGPDGDGSEFSFSNIDMSGNIGIEIYSGSCSGLTLLNDPYCGGAGSYTFETPNCGVDAMYVHVTSTLDGCGAFDLSVTPAVGCSAGEDCGEGPSLAPTTGSGEVCEEGCTTFSCDSDCGSMGGVWFEVTTDELATEMTIVVNDIGSGNIDPVISVFQDECGSGAVIGCAGSPSGNITEIAVSGNVTYYIEVSTGGGGTPGDFELCVATDESEQECSTGELDPTRPEYPGENPDGPYCPGEVVNFCYSVTFTVDPIGQGNNCQWIQGIIPTIGGGWDLEAMPLDIQGPGGSWFWLPEESVAYLAPSSALGLIDTPNGLGLEFGPGSLSNGDLLPGGWWATSDGGGGCSNDGNPNTMWGLPASCGSTQDVEFCFDLQVGFLDDIGQCDDEDFTDLKVHMFTMADGQTGCWSNNSCSGDTPVTFNAILDCTSLVFILAEDAEICSNGVLNIPLESEDGSAVNIIVDVLDEGNTSGASSNEFSGGMGTIADQIENDGSDVEILVYEAYALDPNSVCEGPRTRIEVTVYPKIEIDVDDPYPICYQDPQEITPIVSGGSGGPYEFLWEDGSDDPSITLPLDLELFPGDYEIILVVTDDFGCTEEEVIQYEIIEPVYPMIINPVVGICKDGVLDLPELFLEFESIGTGPYEFEWDSNPGGLQFENGNEEQNLIINEEESSARTYTIFGSVIDEYGCKYTTEAELTVDNGPDMVLEVDECFGTSFNLIGYDRDGLQVTFELFFDAEGDWLYDGVTILNAVSVAQVFGDNITYLAEDNGTYILLGTSTNGCNDYVELDLPPVATPIFEVLPNDTICQGTQITITVANSNEYTNFTWSTGDNTATLVATPSDTITYYLVAETSDDCEITDSIRIVVNPLPEISITGSTSICPGSQTALTAQGDVNNSYLWTGPGGAMITTQTATISTVGTWIVNVLTPSGCLATESVFIDENAQLNPEIDGENLCTGSSATLDGGPGFDSYEWLDEAGGTAGTTQTIDVITGGVYTLNVVLGSGASACSGSDMFTVEQFDPLPNALNALSASVCNINTGGLQTTLDLTNFETGISGNWLDENNLPIIDPTSLDFDGSLPGLLVYQFVTNQAQAPCMDDTYTFAIDISDCGCPSVAISTPSDFCNEADTFNLNLITITSEPGSWSVSPVGMEISNNLLISNDNTSGGIYNLTFTLDDINQPSACAIDSTVQFAVFESLSADIEQDNSVCNQDTGNGPDFIDLDDLFISGDPGVWSTNEVGLTIDADNVVSFMGQDLGDYTFFYFMEDLNSPCNPVSIPVEIRVRDCSCPELALADLPDLCTTGGTFDLENFLLNPESEAGVWTVDGPDDTALVGTSVFSDGRLDGEYEFTFTFTNTFGGSCTNEVSGILNFLAPPSVDVVDAIAACNGTNITVLPTFLDFTELAIGATGVWSAPADFKGGVIDDVTNVDFLGVDPGMYLFTFITDSAVAPCDNVEYTMQVEVRNCNCPSVNFIPPTPLCNDGPALDLNLYLPADAPEGVWSFINGTPAVAIANSSFVDISVLDGFYLFQYTINEVPVGCPDFGQISVEVVSPPDVIHVPSADVCNTTSINGPLCLDLNDFLSGAPGTWTIPAGYDGDASDVSNICFDSEDVGEVLAFVFNTDSGSTTCDERSYTTEITVKDCNCPNLSLIAGPEICNDSGLFDLSILETANIDEGTFVQTGGTTSLAITQDQTDFTGAEPGTYSFSYIPVNMPSSDCDQMGTTSIEVIANPSVGTLAFTDLCVTNGEVIELADMLNDETSGGLWSSVINTSAFDFVNSTFTANGQEPGIYEFIYAFENISPCPNNAIAVTLIVSPEVQPDVENSPCAQANEGSIIVASVPGGSGSYLYSIDGGLTWISDPIFNNLAPGTYTLMIQDQNGCETTMPNITVSEPGPFSVDAGEDRQIEASNDFITLELATSVPVEEIVSIVWTEDGNVICSGGVDQCFIIEVDPDGAATYCATVTDINGCVSEDCVFIRERVVKDVYIPNVFDPTSGNNDVFFIQSDEYVDLVQDFRIYDRWGELVFFAVPNHSPNDKDEGWDGTFNDQIVVQGVYVYVVKILFTDGSTETFAGDITVLR